ncbi:MAG: hypothetical protein OdinLCB4_000875 [Candidatus Odinarchaeum yellowstonii]|uniref:Uncharacterized protein n=1 Tax=Odinarchaeota yellowstonii (strain LCB_4) TaxID=1841599 RepID=A0AAF0D2K6_ODILC|nr:MAG: hypothetical protein OdinLCB4_000875 [Candidatus Odinarchaeum yellowstonii]
MTACLLIIVEDASTSATMIFRASPPMLEKRLNKLGMCELRSLAPVFAF